MTGLFLKKYANKTLMSFKFLIIQIPILLMVFRIIVLEFINNNQFLGVLYSLLNSMLIGVWLNVIGFGFKNKEKTMRFVLLAVASIFMISSASLVGIRITLNIPILAEKVFETNTGQGAIFYISNIALFDAVSLSSFIAEGESK